MTSRNDDNTYLSELFSLNPFGVRNDDLFAQAVEHTLKSQVANNSLYARFLESKHFSLDDFELENLPSISVEVFKNSQRGLPNDFSHGISLQSSSTSGKPSKIQIDTITSKRQSRALTNVMKEVIGFQRTHFLVADSKPNPILNKSLSARSAAVIGYLKFSKEVTYLMSEDSDGFLELQENFVELIAKLCELKEPVVVFGFTYVLFESALRQLARKSLRFKLPHGSKLIHIGGWKKLEGIKISKGDFSGLIYEHLGILPENVINVYGFTEQMGINYPECRNGWKHIPNFSNLRVIDVRTGHILRPGLEGLLEFTSPIPNSYPGIRVLTDDVGVLNPNNCDCGWNGQSFLMLRRRENAEIRGCGDILGSKLRVGAYSHEDASQITSPLRVYLGEELELENSSGEAAKLEVIIKRLRSNQDLLQKLTTQDILGVFEMLREIWQIKVKTPEYAGMRNNGMGFLVNWINSENLRGLLDSSLMGNKESLELFVPAANDTTSQIRALPRGLVVQWVSGNVPLLGMFPIVQALLTRNPILVRVSSESEDLLSLLLGDLRHLSVSNPIAEILLKNLCIISFPHTRQELQSIMSKNAAVRIAWGGRNALESISSLEHNFEVKDVFFGPRTSLAVIGGSLLANDLKLRNIAKRLASDILVFNQIACASPHTVFIRTNEKSLLDRFAIAIDEELANAKDRFLSTELDDALAAQIRNARNVSSYFGYFLGPEDLSHSVLVKDEIRLSDPIFGHTINLNKFEQFEELIPILHSEVQSIGLALDDKEKLTFAKLAAAQGVNRFPDIGSMTLFQDPWDGISMIQSMVRWVTLGV